MPDNARPKSGDSRRDLRAKFFYRHARANFLLQRQPAARSVHDPANLYFGDLLARSSQG